MYKPKPLHIGDNVTLRCNMCPKEKTRCSGPYIFDGLTDKVLSVFAPGRHITHVLYEERKVVVDNECLVRAQ